MYGPVPRRGLDALDAVGMRHDRSHRPCCHAAGPVAGRRLTCPACAGDAGAAGMHPRACGGPVRHGYGPAEPFSVRSLDYR